MAKKAPETSISQEQLCEFLGVDLATAPQPQPDSGSPHLGWPCAVDAPVCRMLRAMFPIDAGETASIERIGDRVFCVAPDELRAMYYLTFEIQLVVRGWRSPVQPNYAPPIPVLVDGQCVVGKRTLRSPDALVTWYQREIDKHRAAVVRRLQQCQRSRDEHVQSLMAHDVWS